MIPILNLTRQYAELAPDIERVLLEVAASGNYILGPNVRAFEQEMADFLGTPHVIGCANGSDALYLALRALGIGVGDEVITTPFSFIATSESIVRVGAKPVFVDIDPKTFNLSPEKIERAITPRTKAIMPVHIFGLPADMDAIMALAKDRELFVIEDAAQAINALHHNRQAGTIGDIGCFSFFPSKNLGAFGDGGMLATRNPKLADRLKMLRVHGSKTRYYHDEPGINSRLDEIQAAVLRVKLPHLNRWTTAREQAAGYYNELLKPLSDCIETPVCASHVRHVYHQYTIRIKGRAHQDVPVSTLRDRLQQQLADAGVQSMIYYPVPFYKQKTHQNLGYQPFDFPETELAAAQVLSLPMFPEITTEEQETVCNKLSEILATEFNAISAK